MEKQKNGNGGREPAPQANGLSLGAVSTELDDAANALSRAAELLRRMEGNGTSGLQRQSRATQTAPALEARLTVRQLAAIHAASRRRGLEKEKLDQLLAEVVGAPTDVACLTREQASQVLDHLNGKNGHSS